MKKIAFILFLVPLFSVAMVPTTETYDVRMPFTISEWSQRVFSQFVSVTYYCSAGASGTNSGTISNPYTSVSSAMSHQGSFNPGDFLLFERGKTYTSGQINVSVNGSSGNPITFGNYGSGELPTFTGTASTFLDNLFYMNSRSYLVFDGLKLIDPTIDTTLTGTARDQLSHIRRAFTFDNSSHHNIVRNCKITATGLFVFFAIGSHDNLGEYSRCNDLTMIVATDDGGQPGNDDDYGCNVVVNAGNDNALSHVTGVSCYGYSPDYTLDGGNDIISTGTGTADNFRIDYCYFFDCIGALEIKGNCTGTIMTYSLFINCGQTITYQSGTIDVTVYNCDFIETTTERPGQSDKMFATSSSHTLIIKNCLFWLINGVDAFTSTTGLTHQYNVYRVTGGSAWGVSNSTGESSTASNIWASMTGAAESWNYFVILPDAQGTATTISGLSTLDYFGNPIANYMGPIGPLIPTTKSYIKQPVWINGKLSIIR